MKHRIFVLTILFCTTVTAGFDDFKNYCDYAKNVRQTLDLMVEETHYYKRAAYCKDILMSQKADLFFSKLNYIKPTEVEITDSRIIAAYVMWHNWYSNACNQRVWSSVIPFEIPALTGQFGHLHWSFPPVTIGMF